MENNSKIFNIDDLNLNKNYALEASAGTGKTYSITQIVKKLIYNFKIGLDKILIVTYTEKAAGELKNRIREILTTPEKKYGGKSIAELLEGEVNCDVDNAAIGTIHSFCKNTIKEFVISSKQVIDLELSSNVDLIKFAKRYVRTGKILKDIVNLLSVNYDVKESKLIEYLVDITNLYYLDKNYNEDSKIISYFPYYSSDVLSDLPFQLFMSSDIETTLKENDLGKYNKYLLLKGSSNPKIIEFVELFANFKDFIIDPRTISVFNMTQKSGISKDEVVAFRELFNLKTEFKKFDGEKYLADKYIKDFYKEYQLFKEENRLQSFNDMIREVREKVLEPNSELLKCLREKYTYAIIDEFQDTNQIQFDIFSNVFMCENHNLIVVGDPKQSIYAYQGADVNVYQKAVKLIEDNNQGEKCRLAKNYRSSVGVVEFGNELFKHFDLGSEFVPSLYCLASNSEKERRLKYKGDYASGLWMNKNDLKPQDFAKFAVEQIIKCSSLDENGKTNLQLVYVDDGVPKYKDVKFSDFVVLAKSRREMLFIQQALRNAGIPSLRYKDDSLFKGIECPHWISILEAIDVVDFTGANRGYFKKALKTRFFDLPLSEISKKIYDTDDLFQIQLFNKWRKLAQDKLWQDLFDAIIVDTKLDENMSSLGDVQSLGVFKQLANYSIDYLAEGNTISKLIKHLRNIYKLGIDENGNEKSAIVDKTTDFNCVRIMTMHASKGLQFPVVISVGGIYGLNTKQEVNTWHIQENGESKQIVSLANHEAIMKEKVEELFRLYYVAYTRPEFLLIAPRYDKENNKDFEISGKMNIFIKECENQTFVVDGVNVPYYEFKEFDNTSYQVLETMTKKILDENKNNIIKSDKSEQEKLLVKLIDEKDKKIAYKHSYSSFAHPNKKQDEEFIDDVIDIDKEDEEEQDVIYDLSAKQIMGEYKSEVNTLEVPNGYPKGANVGNALHAIFEVVDFTNLNDEQLINIIEQSFKKEGLKNDGVNYTKTLINNTINALLPIVKGNEVKEGYFKLAEITNKDRKSEIEFNYNYPNEVLKNYLTGAIDLVFRRGDVYSILDWKSDTLNDDFLSYSDAGELKKQVDKRYSIQRVLYSYCLVKWLKQYYNKAEEEIFDNHFGGIYYAFIRGCNENTSNGIYVQTWNSWKDLEKEFNKILFEAKKGVNK